MTYRLMQANFSHGELAPALFGRSDAAVWNASVALARNVIVLKHGGVTKRPGTELVAEALDHANPGVLVPFQFSMTQTYALELGHGYMSPCANGGRVLETELAITSISNGFPAQLTVAFHGFSQGDSVYLAGIAGSMGTLLNGRSWLVTGVPDANTFAIQADTTNCDPFAGASGGITNTAPPIIPAAPVVAAPAPPPAAPLVYAGAAGNFAQYAAILRGIV